MSSIEMNREIVGEVVEKVLVLTSEKKGTWMTDRNKMSTNKNGTRMSGRRLGTRL